MTKISELPVAQGVGRAAWYRRQAHTVITAADHTLVAGDDGKVLVMERETVQVVTVPAGLPAGFACVIVQGGAATTADRLIIDRVIGESELRAQHKVSSACWGGGPGSVITITRLTSTVYAVGGDLYLTTDGGGEIAAAIDGKADIGQAQPIARWSYADATARDAASYVSGDIGLVARVASPLGFWRLAAVTPLLSWEQVGGGSGGAAVGRGAWSARPVTPAVGDYYLCTNLPQTELRCWAAGVWTTYVCGVEVEPRPASYFGSWTNQESASIADVGPFFQMRDGGEAFEWELRSRLRSTPASSNYVVEIGLLAHAYAGGAGVVGYGGGVAVSVGDAPLGTGVTRFGLLKIAMLINSSHRFSAYVSGSEPQPRLLLAPSFGAPAFFRLRDDGTTRFYECSIDRETWVIVDQHARGTHAVPTNWGPFIATGRLAGQQPHVLFVHAREYTL